ncbi:PD-(D/E)XK motif protein [Rhizobium leguminosarum]|uniref:PD-(D/E)XK motif protein n=1 Tax=Rhizobium leguminosarum TaxID=384 RepID=A0A7K3VVT3_RHILE|nr:PD-(D/E)XK motif protein [Rhizobium leguminosarum]NEK20608.1 PD-(D/E)XK motif protein [Rhizobium leguminosarum]NKK38963.1 PD-(D/E)XK motif protein [Rhizobium leguminosarum bv. viciae]
MTTDEWKEIAAAAGPSSDNVRRADAGHPLEFFRGRDFAGRYLLSLAADGTPEGLPDPPRLNGIEVRVEKPTDGRVRLLLTLLDRSQFDLFRDLTDHLLKATADLAKGDNLAGMKLVLKRLRSWHDLLRRRRDDLLTNSEAIGLAGELLFFRDQVLARRTPTQAALSWRGAHRDEQDFALGHWQIEIKTQLSTSDQRLHISSEAQLDAGSARLLICHQTLAPAPVTAPGSFTLNSLVREIATQLQDAGDVAISAFDTALEALGYVDRAEYDEICWVATHRRAFEVTEQFPRIIPVMLPPGVQSVRYDIALRDCEPFAVDFDGAMEQAFA